MKKVLFFGIFLLLLAGCQQENSLTGPVTEPSSFENSAKSQDFLIIPLPAPSEMRLNKEVTSATELVTVTGGGTLSINYKYKSDAGRNVKVAADLYVPPYAVNADVELTMGISDTELSAYVELAFGPSQTEFNTPALLNVSAKGLDLSMLSASDELKLVYMNDSGEWLRVNAASITFDIKKGIIECVGGEIPHFSRYGFTR